MGIYDREYIRGESSGTGLFSGVTPVTKSIIVISFVVFFLENLLRWDSDGITIPWLAASPEFTFHKLRLHQLLTSTFVHWGASALMALIFDMWFFWFVGRDMETLYGSRDFLIFYLVSAVLTTAAGLAVAQAAGMGGAVIFGSWGPILAVMTLFTLYYPKREILFLFFIPMPMWVLLAIYTVVPVLGHFSGSGGPSIGVGMILAAVGFAYSYKQLDLRWSRLVSGRGFRPRLRIFSSADYDQPRPRGWSPSRSSSNVGGGSRSSAVSVLPEEQLDARLDEILAKIARDGNRDNLTDDERRVLEEASRRARIRRSDRL
jgi:membrane associated rhomboid family serine protease